MKDGSTIRNMIYVSLMAVVIALCSWISVPAAVPFTMQTFAVCLIAALLGWRLGLESFLLYSKQYGRLIAVKDVQSWKAL